MPRTPAGWSQSLWGCLERGSGSAVLGARMKRQAGETASWGQLIQGPRLPPGRDPTDTYPPLSEAGAPARLQAGSSAPAARGPVCCVLGGPLAELWAPGWTKQAPGVGVQVGRCPPTTCFSDPFPGSSWAAPWGSHTCCLPTGPLFALALELGAISFPPSRPQAHSPLIPGPVDAHCLNVIFLTEYRQLNKEHLVN